MKSALAANLQNVFQFIEQLARGAAAIRRVFASTRGGLAAFALPCMPSGRVFVRLELSAAIWAIVIHGGYSPLSDGQAIGR